MTHPNYSKIIKHLSVTEQLEVDGLQDQFEELILNDFVQVIAENHPTLVQDEIVDTVYDAIRKVLSSFQYFNNCTASDGYSAAMFDIKQINEEAYNKLVEEVNKSANTSVDDDKYVDLD